MLELPHKPHRGERFEVTIERLDHDGRGVALIEAAIGPQAHHRTYRVLVRKGLPGDRAAIVVERCRRGVLETRIAELIEPSPTRVEPRCVHFGRREESGKGCGGCTLQSLPYTEQLQQKRQLVERSLAKAKVTVEVPPVLACAEPWHYRNKMEYSFGRSREGQLTLGLHPVGYRHDVLDLQQCYLLSPFAVPLLNGVRKWATAMGLQSHDQRREAGFLRSLVVREGKRTGARLVELITAGAETLDDTLSLSADEVARRFGERVVELGAELGEPITSVFWTQQITQRGVPTRMLSSCLHGAPHLRERLELPGGGALELQIHPRAFFQPNTLQAEVLYGRVIELAGLGGPDGPLNVLDLYCGTGTIALCLAACGAEQVTGVELVGDAVENARHNAAVNGLARARFFSGDAAKVLRDELDGQSFDLVVVDPPRSGLMAGAIDQLRQLSAPRIVYVSCNPRALGRDLAMLATGGYSVHSIQPVDLFPHTAHVETVALLVRDRLRPPNLSE